MSQHQGTKLGTKARSGTPKPRVEPSSAGAKVPRKRRIRSPHPGVKLKRREGAKGTAWRAHYVDPATGREVAVTLPSELTSATARTTWAKALAADLAAAKRDARPKPIGAPPEPVTIGDALDRYLADAAHRLRRTTIETYGVAFAKLRAWGEHERVKFTLELTPPRLASLRAWLVAAPKLAPARGAERGSRRAAGAPRSPVSVNRELRSVATLLTSWRRLGLVPLSSDEIADGLRRLPQDRDVPAYLASADLRRLLDASIRHDAETYALTRAEHDGEAPPGSTPRHPPIAAFVALVLATGMRRGEALALTWGDLDLDARDASGAAVGELRVRPEVAKTRMGRVVGLEVSPRVRKILAALRLRAGRDAKPEARVFAWLTEGAIVAARQRLVQRYGAPPAFTWQLLRSTCSTFLVNAPSIYGAASAFVAAKQLGHSVVVAERRYAGLLRGVPREAKNLDDAMQIARELDAVLAAELTRAAPMAARPRVRIAGRS